jgi:AhpD family alkylhydroperoxidase
MTRSYPALDLSSAPTSARPLLEGSLKKFGKIPSPLARLANSPIALQAALAGLDAFEHSSLVPLEREVVAMTLATRNGCNYCLGLHRKLLRLLDAPPELCAALEHATALATPKLEALRQFTLALLDRTGDVTSAEWQAFLAAGYDRTAALDVVLGIGAYTLTTFANRLTEAPLD